MIKLYEPTRSLEEDSMIKLNGSIRAPIDRRILELIRSIEIPEEDIIINFNGQIITLVARRVINLISPIGNLEGLGVSQAPWGDCTLRRV